MRKPASRLVGEWRKDAAGLSGERDAVFADLMRRHSELHRRHHGASHLLALLDLLAKHAPQIAPGSALRLAIWWHDAVHDPAARDNEEQSAELARIQLTRLGSNPDVIGETTRLILMTKDHWQAGSAGDGDAFLDADLAILGAPPAVYERYAADIQQEFSRAPETVYRAGRSAFLQRALSRPRLFRTDAFEATYAAQARINMRRELTLLS